MTKLAGETKRIVILGGGFAGAYALKTARKAIGGSKREVLLLDRNNYLLFYPLLVESGVGSIEARHVVVPIRKFLGSERFEMAEVKGIDLHTQSVTYQVIGSERPTVVSYDHLVIGLGSVTKQPDIAGLAEFGFTLKTLDDAIGLRDRAIRLLEMANATLDPGLRKEMLTVVTVGANYTGVEFAGEFYAFMCEAAKDYPNVDPGDLRMVLVEFADRILGGTTEKLAEWCQKTLLARGLEIETGTTLKEVGKNFVITTKGQRIPCRTVVWAAGIAPNPLLAHISGLPLNDRGYIDCNSDLSVKGLDNVWAIGDNASVLDPNGRPFGTTAQTASREGPLVMKNIQAKLSGEPTTPFNYKNLGAFAAIGDRQAAADVMGLQVSGFLGWVLYRATYLMKMPSLSMKFRLIADWLTELVFKNEPVQLGVHRYRGTSCDNSARVE